VKNSRIHRSLWRLLGAALLALGTWLAVPAAPAYAISSCEDETGEQCRTDKACIFLWPSNTFICLTRYYYRQMEAY
jgi:hypothetical protein